MVSVENVANGEAVSRFKSIKGDRFVVAVGGAGEVQVADSLAIPVGQADL